MKYGPDATVDEAPKDWFDRTIEVIQVIGGCAVMLVVVYGVFRLLFEMMCALFTAF